MPDNRASTLLQSSSHILVVGAGLIYVFGFVIISIHDATYGIADFSLFRTKVVAVGTLFAILVALGMVLAFRTFALFGFTVERPEAVGVTVTEKNRRFAIAFTAMSVPFVCYATFVPLVFLFDEYPEPKTAGIALMFTTMAIGIALGLVGAKRWLDTRPFVLLFLSGLNTTAFFVLLFKYVYFDRTLFWFTLWLSFVCIFTLYIYLKLQKSGDIRKMEWEQLFAVIVGLLFFVYAGKVYPKIRHQFGGGAPVPIVLHLTKKLPPLGAETATVSLIDETEQGYYVLSGDDKAMFVARGLVEEVEFLRNSPTPQTVPAKP